VQKSDQDSNVVSFGMPQLQSELGLRMQRLVKAEEWYQKAMNVQEEFLVASSILQDETTSLAYRRSKCTEDRELDIGGPRWGTTIVGVDDKDGWVKVENLYLPMTLAGTRVLTPCSDTSHRRVANAEPMLDGPALTEDGRVLDLDGGAAIFFGCDPTLASGHTHKTVMINAIKDVKNVQRALDASRAAAEVDLEEICSIDAAGVLHGEESLSPAFAATEAATAAAARLKLFSQKCKSRRSGDGDGTVGIDPNGKAFLFLYLPDGASKAKKRRFKEQAAAAATASHTVMSADIDGMIRD